MLRADRDLQSVLGNGKAIEKISRAGRMRCGHPPRIPDGEISLWSHVFVLQLLHTFAAYLFFFSFSCIPAHCRHIVVLV